MNYSIRKLAKADIDYIEEVCELLGNGYDSETAKFFIYQDPNYKNYLSSTLGGLQDVIYIVLSSREELMGFAQVRLIQSTVFLNNIIIKPEFRGSNIATSLLAYMISSTESSQHIQTFALDVFEKNTAVLKWYMRLGMTINGVKYWYNLMDQYRKCAADTGSSDILLKEDNSGFIQIFAGNKKIGTLIDGKTVVMRSEADTKLLTSLKRHFESNLKGLCLVTEQELSYPVIDRSYHLQVEVDKLQLQRD